MAPKSLFIIIVRIIGLFLLLDTLTVIPSYLNSISFIVNIGDAKSILIGIIFSTLIVVLYIMILFYVLFKTEKVVDRLSLYKNFDEEKIELNIHSSTLIKIAILIIGGMMFLDNIVPVVLNLFGYIKSLNDNILIDFDHEKSISTMAFVHNLIKSLIGYLLVSNCRVVAIWVEKKIRKQ